MPEVKYVNITTKSINERKSIVINFQLKRNEFEPISEDQISYVESNPESPLENVFGEKEVIIDLTNIYFLG